MTIQASLGIGDLRREGVRTATLGETLGAFEFGDDEDYFLFQPEPARSYRITVDSPADTTLGLFDTPFLERVVRDDQSGPGDAPALIVEAGNRPVTLLFEVDTAFALEPGEVGGMAGPLAPYALVIEEVAPPQIPPPSGDIVGETLASAGGIATEAPVVEVIETPADIDWFTAWLERDRAYAIDLTALDGTLLPFLQVQAPGGAVVADAAATGDVAGLVFEPVQSGFHVLTVSDETFGGSGAYELRLAEAGPAPPPGDAVGDTLAGAAPIEAGLVLPGRIDGAADVDLYRVVLEAGSDYSLGVVGTGAFDPTLAVLDDTGRELRFVEDVGGTLDAAIPFVAGYTGVHYLEVAGAAGSVGLYEVGVLLEDPGRALPSEVREIALIYEAGLDRPADVGGLNFWVDGFEGGLTLRQIANSFLDSPEFRGTVGNPAFLTDRELVRGLYENVLDRPADLPGLDFWLSVLDRPGTGPDDLLIAFARSDENQRNAVGVDDIVYDDTADAWFFA